MEQVPDGVQWERTCLPVCNIDFSIAGGGVYEVKHHCRSTKRNSFFDDVLAQSSITFVLQKMAFKYKEAKAEIYLACFVAEHCLSFALVDHFTKLCKCMFLDSKIP